MGKPLLATYWSGSTEFMTPANSFPLAHGEELLPIPSGAFAGHLQAEPSGPALAQLMRQVAGDGGVEGAKRGAQARAEAAGAAQRRLCAAAGGKGAAVHARGGAGGWRLGGAVGAVEP